MEASRQDTLQHLEQFLGLEELLTLEDALCVMA